MAMNVQKQIAKKFVEYWTFQRGSEKGEDQQFWNSLLGEVLGLEDVKSHVQYQVPVPMKGTTKFLDEVFTVPDGSPHEDKERSVEMVNDALLQRAYYKDMWDECEGTARSGNKVGR